MSRTRTPSEPTSELTAGLSTGTGNLRTGSGATFFRLSPQGVTVKTAPNALQRIRGLTASTNTYESEWL